MIDEIQRLRDRFVAEIADIDAAHGNGQADRGKALAMAGIAGNRAHIGFDFLFDPVALRFTETPLKIIDDSLKFGFIDPASVFVAALNLYLFALRAIKEDIDNFRRKLSKRRVERKMIVFGQRRHVHRGDRAAFHRPSAGFQAALADGKGLVRNNQVGVNFHKDTESRTFGTRAERIVKGKHARSKLLHADAVLRAGVVLGKGDIVPPGDINHDNSAGKRGGRFDGIGQSGVNRGVDDQPVDNDLDRMFLIFFKLNGFRQIIEIAVHTHTDKTALARGVKLFGMFALASPHHGSKHLNLCSLFQIENAVDNLVNGLLLNFPTADRAVRDSDSRVQKTQIVVNLRYRSDRGTGIFRSCLLIDGNGRGKPLDVIHIRLFHLPQKLARIG